MYRTNMLSRLAKHKLLGKSFGTWPVRWPPRTVNNCASTCRSTRPRPSEGQPMVELRHHQRLVWEGWFPEQAEGWSHQCAQTTPWTESLSLSRRCWHATVGGPGGDCRQSDQYRSIPGGNEQRIEIKPPAAITKRGKRKDGDKMAARKEPTGWVQGIASPRSLFLRRRVATRSFDKVQRQD